MPKLIQTAAAMRTPENGPRKAANVAPMNRTYLIIVSVKMTVVQMLKAIFVIIKEKIELVPHSPSHLLFQAKPSAPTAA